MAHDPVDQFGTLLRRLRRGAGLTQEELAGRARLSVDAIAALERGRRTAPRARTVRLLADALELAGPARAELRDAASRSGSERATATLPSAPDPFVDREREREAIVRLLRREDLSMLTLTGPGGVGKTRLAISAAAKIAGELADGAAFVSLASLREPELVASTAAQALGLRGGTRPAAEQLLSYLSQRELLLLLDNFEHLLEASPLVARLASECPRVTVLVTSRAALRLRVEHQFQVPPLTLPSPSEEEDTGSAAVELFMARAQDICPGFASACSNRAAIAEVCRRLDGLPLAIELAAARTDVLAPEELRDRLGRSLELLGEGPRDLPSRQRTLRATIDWSHALLPPPARALFARLAVFQGGAMLDAIERVTGGEHGAQTLQSLTLLVDHHLIRAVDDGGPRRFLMLETIHEYARERLAEHGEADQTRRQHALYYLELAEQAEPAFDTGEHVAWLERLDREHDNLRAALGWAADHPADQLGLRLASALWWYWCYHGHLREGRQAIEQQLDHAAEHALPDSLRARALGMLGWLCMHQGDFRPARANMDASLVLARKCDDIPTVAFALTGLGSLGVWAGDPDRARQHDLLEKACNRWRELGQPTGLHFALRTLGVLAFVERDLTAARALVEQALGLAAAGGQYHVAQSCCVLGLIAQASGDPRDGGGWFRKSLTHSHELRDPFILAYSLEGLAWVASTEHRASRSARLLGAATGLRAVIGSPVASPALHAHETLTAAIRGAIGADRFEREQTVGASLTIEEAVAYALDHP